MQGGGKGKRQQDQQNNNDRLKDHLLVMNSEQLTNFIVKTLYRHSLKDIKEILKLRNDVDYEKILLAFLEYYDRQILNHDECEDLALLLLKKTDSIIPLRYFVYFIDSNKLVNEIIKNRRLDLNEKLFSFKSRSLINYLFDLYCQAVHSSDNDDIKKYSKIAKLLSTFYEIEPLR